jgi:hypothetical protein
MATLILGAVGSAIGGAIGGNFLGFTAAAIGGAVGTFAGRIVDSAILGALQPTERIEGARLDDLRVTGATEGAVIPRVYGTMRIGGNIIWATDFREEVIRTRQGGGGKGFGGGGVETTEYRYFASFAVGLCEGPIGGVGRVWADGKPMDLSGVIWRVHRGTEDQEPDPFIVAKEGAGQVPAYRGTAYVVFEELPLADFGNRLPQLSFEVIRPSPDPEAMENRIGAVTLIPSSGEFVYATEAVNRTTVDGRTVPENVNNAQTEVDFTASMDRLDAALPACEAVSLVVSWFGTDLRAGSCQIRPGVETGSKPTAPRLWSVNGIARVDAYTVSQIGGIAPVPAYGGTPADFAVVQAIQDLKARGKRVTFYPFVLMDIPADNTFPNPYSANAAQPGQAVYPWRGRITCSPAPGFAGSPDKTAAAATQIAAFFGNATAANFAVVGETVSWTGPVGDWGLRRMILHYAHLCAAAGGVDAFLIGSELRGITTVRSGAATYPAVAALQTLAADVSAILGPSTLVSYAADWSEYWGHNPGDGSSDFFFHLDPLWASPNIDFIGIDNYQPLSDWRDGDDHADAAAGWSSIYQTAYLQANVEGGEGFDWFYASPADRDAQVRTPITDGAHGKPWVFRYKDLRGWWSNQHFNRPGGTEAGPATAWVPGSKPFRFTEAGTAAVDRSTNQPNVFVDPKSSESFLPYFSRGWPDEALQRRYAEALIGYWADPANNPAAILYTGRMIQTVETAFWTWDARPFPAFPARTDVWTDTENWRLGHWLTGRAGGSGLAELVRELCTRAGVPSDLIDTAELAGSVPGFVIGALESPRASIETLSKLFGFDGVETGGAIRFVPRGRRPVATILPEALVAANREADDLILTRAQETELPRALKWRISARDEEFAGITVEARRPDADSVRTVAEQLPIAATSGAAERGVRRALFEQWIGRETAAFGLPVSRIALDPADTILVRHDGRDLELTITGATDGEFRRIEARRSDRALADLAPGAERRPAAPLPKVYGVPLVALMNLPRLSADFADWQPYIAAHATPWIGDAAVWRSETEDGFENLTTIRTPGLIGVLASDFYAGPANRWDRGNVLQIDLLAGSLASVSDTEALKGRNAVAVEAEPDVWEIVGFAAASFEFAEGAYRRWKLTRLLRGLLGTEDAMRNPVPEGARVVVLDAGVKPVPILPGEFGAEWNWRIGPAARPPADPTYRALAFTPTGRGLRTFSPCQLRRVPLAGGDLRLSWVRRTRDFGGDNWALAEAPLGETAEAYELEILDGVAVVRTVAGLSAPSFVYTAAMQTADFGAPQASVRFRVFQIGALGRGPGAEAQP